MEAGTVHKLTQLFRNAPIKLCKGHINRVTEILDYIWFMETYDESVVDDPTRWNMNDFRKWRKDDRPKSHIIQPTTETDVNSNLNTDNSNNKEAISNNPINEKETTATHVDDNVSIYHEREFGSNNSVEQKEDSIEIISKELQENDHGDEQ